MTILHSSSTAEIISCQKYSLDFSRVVISSKSWMGNWEVLWGWIPSWKWSDLNINFGAKGRGSGARSLKCRGSKIRPTAKLGRWEEIKKEVQMPVQSDENLIRNQLAAPHISFVYLRHLEIRIKVKGHDVCLIFQRYAASHSQWRLLSYRLNYIKYVIWYHTIYNLN